MPVSPELEVLGMGERQAIWLAQELGAAAIIIDEEKGRQEASRPWLVRHWTSRCSSRRRRTGSSSTSAGAIAPAQYELSSVRHADRVAAVQ